MSGARGGRREGKEINGEELIARHQIVREFVEKEFPETRVTEIAEDAKTTYKRKAGSLDEYVLASAGITFRVEAQPLSKIKEGVQCKVAVMEDGSLRVYDTYWVRYGAF